MTDVLAEVLLGHREDLRTKGLLHDEWVFVHHVGRHKGKPFKEYRRFPRDLCLMAQVKPFGTHSIRHLTASILAKEGVPLTVIQAILGHKKISTTDRYIRELEETSSRVHLDGVFGKGSRRAVERAVEKKRANFKVLTLVTK